MKRRLQLTPAEPIQGGHFDGELDPYQLQPGKLSQPVKEPLEVLKRRQDKKQQHQMIVHKSLKVIFPSYLSSDITQRDLLQIGTEAGDLLHGALQQATVVNGQDLQRPVEGPVEKGEQQRVGAAKAVKVTREGLQLGPTASKVVVTIWRVVEVHQVKVDRLEIRQLLDFSEEIIVAQVVVI